MSVNVVQMDSQLDADAADVHLEQTHWLTPGLVLAEEVATVPQVRLVLERMQDRFQIFVVLDDDPDEALDQIFAAERKLFTTLAGMPFDLRVMRPSDDWDASLVRSTALLRYERVP